jgi:phosphinothricin acetyltransferase
MMTFSAYIYIPRPGVYRREGLVGMCQGSEVLDKLPFAARDRGYHSVVSRIAAGNELSVKLHEMFGFETVGVQKEAGKKFGRRLNIVVMQKNFPEKGGSDR